MALLPVIPVVLVPLFILYKTKGSTLAKVCMHLKCCYGVSDSFYSVYLQIRSKIMAVNAQVSLSALPA